MRSRRSLRQWMVQLLPTEGRCARHAAWSLLRALMLGFHVDLAQLGRQLDRESTAKSGRQYLTRWLDGAQWHPPLLYGRLLRLTARTFQGRPVLPLLVDLTDLADGWQVLQVSLCFQGRALPLYRSVRSYAGAVETQALMVEEALGFLREYLPGPRRKYVLIMDRGFPSHGLVRRLQAGGWRFVLRVKDNWKVTHTAYQGRLRGLGGTPQVGATPQVLRDAQLGDPTRGEKSRVRHCQAHLVTWQEEGHEYPWFLITSEADPREAVRLYRLRMRIECEFRDLKGPLGLDALANWCDQDRVARFLAWMAVYEWRLAYLWLMHRLVTYAVKWQVKGPLSWIRTTREWLAYQLRAGTFQPDACL